MSLAFWILSTIVGGWVVSTIVLWTLWFTLGAKHDKNGDLGLVVVALPFALPILLFYWALDKFIKR